MATLPKLTPAQTALVRRLVRQIRAEIKRGATSRSYLPQREFGYGAGTDYAHRTVTALAARGLVTRGGAQHGRPSRAGYGREHNEHTVWTLNLFFKLTPLFLEIYDETEAKAATGHKNPAPLNTARRSPAAITVSAGRGDVRAARALVGNALREVLRIRRWGEAPHAVAVERNAGGDPQYEFDATPAEFAAVLAHIRESARREGWSRAPIDAYMDTHKETLG